MKVMAVDNRRTAAKIRLLTLTVTFEYWRPVVAEGGVLILCFNHSLLACPNVSWLYRWGLAQVKRCIAFSVIHANLHICIYMYPSCSIQSEEKKRFPTSLVMLSIVDRYYITKSVASGNSMVEAFFDFVNLCCRRSISIE